MASGKNIIEVNMYGEIIEKVKKIVDVMAFTMLILYMGVGVTGEENHELIGISLISLFIFHAILNFDWFISVKNNMFRSKSSLSDIFFFMINLFIIIVFVIFVISHIGASYKIFASFGIKKSRAYIFASELSSLLLFILMGIQLGALKAKRGLFKNNKKAKITAWVCILVLAFLGGNAMARRDLSEKFTYYYDEKSETKVEEDYIGNLFLDYILMTFVYFAIGYGMCVGARRIDKSEELKGE